MVSDNTKPSVSFRNKRVPRQIPTELGPGFILDNRYELLRKIGQGGMGMVYEANHQTLQKRMAVKLLNKFGDYDEVTPKRFLAEAQIQSSLKHPNIVEVTDGGVSAEGHRYIVMELLQGESLTTWLEKTPPEDRDNIFIQKLIHIMLEICDGLQTAHNKNIIHRDIKPSNIFLNKNEFEGQSFFVSKILDFGLAKQTDQETKGLTLTGDIPGTTEYVSPEQFLGKKPNQCSDIYSLGVVLYEALTGKKPFEVEGKEAFFIKMTDPKYKVVPPKKINPHIPEKLNRICLKAMERDPVNRFQMVEDLAGVLYQVPNDSVSNVDDSEVGNGSSMSNYSHNSQPSVSNSRTVFAIIAAVLVVSLVFAFVWFGNIEPTEPEENIISSDFSESELEPKSEKLPLKEIKIEEPLVKEPELKEEVEEKSIKPKHLAKKTPAKNFSKAGFKSENNTDKISEADEGKEPKANIEEEERVKELVREGDIALEKMNLSDADRFYDEAVRLAPRTPKALFGLGRIAIERKKYQDAINRISRALQYRNVAKWRIILGQVYLISGSKEAAIREWKRILKEHLGNNIDRKNAEKLLRENGAVSNF